MAKLKKKYVSVGAPLYMSQFTMIMLILIVMCMLMSTMSKKQETGFDSGEGGYGKEHDLNALGINIGSGQFKFGTHGRARSYSPNPGTTLTYQIQNPHKDALKGEGGTGNTDLNIKKTEIPRYLFARMKINFPDKSAAMTREVSDNLSEIALALNLFDSEVIIKIYAGDFKQDSQDLKLAWERAAKIMNFFYKNYKLPINKMSFITYSNRELLGLPPDKDAAMANTTQDVLFYFKVGVAAK